MPLNEPNSHRNSANNSANYLDNQRLINKLCLRRCARDTIRSPTTVTNATNALGAPPTPDDAVTVHQKPLDDTDIRRTSTNNSTKNLDNHRLNNNRFRHRHATDMRRQTTTVTNVTDAPGTQGREFF